MIYLIPASTFFESSVTACASPSFPSSTTCFSFFSPAWTGSSIFHTVMDTLSGSTLLSIKMGVPSLFSVPVTRISNSPAPSRTMPASFAVIFPRDSSSSPDSFSSSEAFSSSDSFSSPDSFSSSSASSSPSAFSFLAAFLFPAAFSILAAFPDPTASSSPAAFPFPVSASVPSSVFPLSLTVSAASASFA